MPSGENMAINRDFRDLLSVLSAASARFLVVGTHAVIYYTVPRYTRRRERPRAGEAAGRGAAAE